MNQVEQEIKPTGATTGSEPPSADSIGEREYPPQRVFLRGLQRNFSDSYFCVGERGYVDDVEYVRVDLAAPARRSATNKEKGIPDGATPIEAYEQDGEIIVLGIPPSEEGVHNCDEMGCGFSHVLYRFHKL